MNIKMWCLGIALVVVATSGNNMTISSPIITQPKSSMETSASAMGAGAKRAAGETDEEKSARIKNLVPGEWVYTEQSMDIECPAVNAVWEKVFWFGGDGKVHLTESNKGQSASYLKEDWLFESWGTYGYKGDTIMIYVNRFAAVRQIFERLRKIDGKEVWKVVDLPHFATFDSVITDGSQDRYIIYDDLKLNFKKVK